MPNPQEYKCPCCGGGIAFDANAQKMKCPYCDTEFEIETLASYQETLQETKPDAFSWDTEQIGVFSESEQAGLRSWLCHSCGGEIIGDPTTAATACPYCGNPVVMNEQLSGVLKPDYVIPFKLNKEAAKQGLLRHYQGKRLLPKCFKDENRIDQIKGIYAPFWLFDADVSANIRYRGTKTRAWSDRKYHYVETSFYSVLRDGEVHFDHLPVDGSAKLPDDLMESIEPYRFEDAVDFQTAYLAGYLADRYDVTAEQSINRANTRSRTTTENLFAKSATGYDTLTPESTSVQIQNGVAKYALYPVWLLNTNWKGKTYTFAMNGQTGKVVGNLPVDKAAYWRWFLGIMAGVAAAVMGITYLFWFL